MENSIEQTHTKVLFLMNRSFIKFGTQQREDFLNDLSDLVAYPREEFHQVKFWDGCVRFQSLLPIVAVIRLLKTLELIENKESMDSEEVIEMQNFISKHSVTSIYSQFIESIKDFSQRLSDVSRYSNHQPELEQRTKYICFIHGWRWEGEIVKKECKKTFSKLPELLSAHFNCQSNFFDYKTGVSPKAKSLYWIAKALNNKLYDLYLEYKRTSETEIKDFKIILITHSAGGIVARKSMTLDIFKEERHNHVKHITLIASPATGVSLLNLVSNLPFVSDQVRELAQGSAFIDELNTQWGHWRKLNPECKVRCIYGPEDQVVSSTEASILDPDSVCILGVDHVSIKTVESPEDELFKTLVNFLEEANLSHCKV